MIRHLVLRPFWALEDHYGRWGFLVPTHDGHGWTRIRFFTQARANTARALMSKCGELPGFGLVCRR